MTNRQVVLIEDDAGVREVLTLLLESQGWRVAAAPDGTSGFAMVESVGPDVVVTDLRLPGMSGLDIAAALAAQPPGRAIPVIAITSDSSRLRARAIKSGDFVRVLTKPLDPHALISALTEGLASH